MNIWDIMYEPFKFKKDTITLFESFSGIGSQHIALDKLAKELNFKLDVVGISEIDKYAIASYNAIHGETKNYGSITDIQEIPQVDIFTYSFPCQDISLAGNQKGFSRNSGTRSGLLWEVERLLENQEKINKLPKVLLMENVKALAGVKFIDDFTQWREKLKTMGYKNYWEILNSKNYGIPQNRERVFMISVLGDYSFNFPKPFPLKLRLKDMLEKEVDEKYYINDFKYLFNNTKGDIYDRDKALLNKKVAYTLNTKPNRRVGDSNYIYENNDIEEIKMKDVKKIHLKIQEDTKKGYAKAHNGDGVYINRPHQKRGVVQKDMIQTIKTNPDVGVVENMRIRKLTPKECYRLMGFSDSDFENAASVCSNSQLYKQAGNSIVVNVLYYIFKELF